MKELEKQERLSNYQRLDLGLSIGTEKKSKVSQWKPVLNLLTILGFLLVVYRHFIGGCSHPTINRDICPIRPVVKPSGHPDINSSTILNILYDESFKSKSIEKLAGAIQVNTEGYDGTGPVGEDPRWNRFADFHVYL